MIGFRAKSAALALGAILAMQSSASAQDQTLRLGGSSPGIHNAPAADTMNLGGQGTLDAARESDTELTRGYGRGGWGGGVRVGVGYRGGWGGVRVGVGWGGGWGRGGWYGGRGWYGGYRGGWYGGGVRIAVGYPYYRPYYSTGYPIVYSSGFCGVAATPIDLSTQAIPLNFNAQANRVPVIRIPSSALPPLAPVNDNRTFPYDGGPKQPIPPPIPQETPRAAPEGGDALRVVLRRDDPTLTGLKYAYKAYGEK